VSDSDSELTGNRSPVSGSSHEVSVLDSSVSSDSGLGTVDTSHLDGDLSLDVSLSVVENSSSLVLSSHMDGKRVLGLEDSSHLLGAESEGNLLGLVSNGSHLSVNSNSSSSVRDLLVVDGKGHFGLGNLGEADELGLESSGGNTLDVLPVVDTSPVGDSLGHDVDLLDDNSVGVSKSQPDGSEVSLLDELEVVISSSSSELDLELSDLFVGSLFGSSVGSDSESVNPDFVRVSDLDHDSLSDKHRLVHLVGSVVSTKGKFDGVLRLGNEDELSLDGESSLVVGNSAVVDGKLVGLDGTDLRVVGDGVSLSSPFACLNHHLEVMDHGVFVSDSLLHFDVSNSHGSSGNSRDSSMVDHVFVGLSRLEVSSLGLSESDKLESKSVEVLSVGNSGRSLGLHSQSGGMNDLDSPGVDNSSIVGHGLSGVMLGHSLVLKSNSGSVDGKSQFVERFLKDNLSTESELVHSVGSSLTTDGLSVVVESNTLGMLAHLGLTDEALLGLNLEVEGTSHHSGSSGESEDRGGSLRFSSVLGLEGTTGHELGVASGTDSSLLLGVSVSSGLNSQLVFEVGGGVSSDSSSLSEESEVFSSVHTLLMGLPGHHRRIVVSESDVSLVRSVFHDLGSLAGNVHLFDVVFEESDSALHVSPLLVSVFLHLASSGDLDGEVSSSSDHDSHVVHLFGDHLFEVFSGVSESAVSLS